MNGFSVASAVCEQFACCNIKKMWFFDAWHNENHMQINVDKNKCMLLTWWKLHAFGSQKTHLICILLHLSKTVFLQDSNFIVAIYQSWIFAPSSHHIWLLPGIYKQVRFPSYFIRTFFCLSVVVIEVYFIYVDDVWPSREDKGSILAFNIIQEGFH